MWGVVVLTVITAQSLGLFIACSIMDVVTASSVTAVIILFFMLLGKSHRVWCGVKRRRRCLMTMRWRATGGFYVSTQGVLAWLSWIKYLSFMYWGYAALVINEFGNG